MNKVFYRIVFFSLLLLLCSPAVQAGYMLPYPSTMPGNKIYTITRLIDTLKGYWYFGDIAQIKYNLMLSDKYLVEAKTLMQYEQYLLGQDALKRSDTHFEILHELVQHMEQNGKDPKELKERISSAADAHIAVLTMLQSVTPSEFTWTPENGNVTHILLHDMLGNAKNIRMTAKFFVSR